SVDVVVFSAPQLSLYELRDLAALCDDRRFVVPLLAVTSPQVKPDSDRIGYTARIEAAGGTVLSGMCFYQSYAREIAGAEGWDGLAATSARVVNILGGYGYRPVLGSMEAGVDAAVTGPLTRACPPKPFTPAMRWGMPSAGRRSSHAMGFRHATIWIGVSEYSPGQLTNWRVSRMSEKY